MIYQIHRFQHRIHDGIEQIKNSNINERMLLLHDLTAIILQDIQKTILLITNQYVSIHIKIFVQKESKKEILSCESIEDVYLKVFERVPSSIEKKLVEKGKLKKRDSDGKQFFMMEKWPEDCVKNINFYIEKLKKLKGVEYLKVNSAYNYVLSPTTHNWISNDLEKDEKEGKFYSTNVDYYDYYKSLGIFVICSPANKTVDEIPIGILVIDSLQKNVFKVKFITELLGYFSHRLYDFLIITFPV